MEISYTKIKIIIVLVLYVINQGRLNYDYRSDTSVVSFLDVGMGDSILIKDGKANLILVDGGPDNLVSMELSKRIPHDVDSVDYVIVSHPHADHISGLINIVSEYKIGCLVISDFRLDNSTRMRLLFSKLKLENIIIGQSNIEKCNLPDGLKVFFPNNSFMKSKNLNDLTNMVIFRKDNWGFVFLGDAEYELQHYYQNLLADYFMLEQKQISDYNWVMKVPHQGGIDAFNKEMINYIGPKSAVISVGENNYGHPNRNVVDYYIKRGAAVYRTDLVGSIDFYTD